MKKRTTLFSLLLVSILAFATAIGVTFAKYLSTLKGEPLNVTIDKREYVEKVIDHEDVEAYSFSEDGTMTINSVFFVPNKTRAAEQGKWYKAVGIRDNGFVEYASKDKIKTIVLPATITSVTAAAFSGCSQLDTISVAADNAKYATENGVLYNKDKTELLCYPQNKANDYYIVPSNVTIHDNAFDDAKNLDAIVYNGALDSAPWGAENQALVLQDQDLGSAKISSVTGSKASGYTVTLNQDNSTAGVAYCRDDGEIDYANAKNNIQIPASATKLAEYFILKPAKKYAFAAVDSNNDMYIYNRFNVYRGGSTFTPDGDDVKGTIYKFKSGKPTDAEDPEGIDKLWNEKRTEIVSVTVADPVKPTSVEDWFNSFTALKSINLKSGNTALLDLSGVTSMYQMFYGCSALESIDLSGMNTSNVTMLRAIFYGCSALESFNLSNLNTAQVTDIAYMFYGCTAIESLDVSSFSTVSVTSVDKFNYIFANCTALKAVKVGADWKVTTDPNNMFDGCSALVYQDGQLGSNTVTYTDWDSTNDKANFKVDGYTLKNNPNKAPVETNSCPTGGTATHLAGAVLRSDLTKQVEYGEKLTNSISISSADSGGSWDSHVLTLAPAKMYSYATLPKDATDAAPGPLNLYYRLNRIATTFKPDNDADADNLKIYNFWDYWYSMISDYANPEGSTDWQYLRNTQDEERGSPVATVKVNDQIPFARCRNLFHRFDNCTSIDLTGIDTSKVVLMRSMFEGCKKLEYLDVKIINTSSATDLSGMFAGCEKMKNLEVAHFDTDKVTNMASMFSGCSALTSLDVTNFVTTEVTNMASMFSWCSALTSLDVTKFVTTKVTAMNNMFQSCSNLTALNVTKFVTSNVTTMRSMFNGCYKLQSIDVTRFNTAKVTSMSYMFKACHKFTSLDLSSFDTVSVTEMYQMFYADRTLKTITVGNGWSTVNVATSTDSGKGSTNMFYGCTVLKGQNGTAYDANIVDKTYARVDGGTSSPGYFTLKSA